MTDLSDEIRTFLARHGLSQAALARLLEPGDTTFATTLNRWLRGHQQPRHPGTLRLALAELDRRLARPPASQ